MIAYLRGTVEEVSEGFLVLDVNGIGYRVSVSSRDLSCLPPRGEVIRINTYLNIREDAVQLFGFLSEDDLSVFRLLLSVSGVGPKVALGILSALTADEIRFAVLSDDIKSLGKAPGIGNKTAKKIILELKDKLSLEDAFEQKFTNAQPAGGSRGNGADTEAVEALVALGYSGSEALRAVREIEATEDMDTEQILRLALKRLI